MTGRTYRQTEQNCYKHIFQRLYTREHDQEKKIHLHDTENDYFSFSNSNRGQIN